jgi:hypothetical protein
VCEVLGDSGRNVAQRGEALVSQDRLVGIASGLVVAGSMTCSAQMVFPRAE